MKKIKASGKRNIEAVPADEISLLDKTTKQSLFRVLSLLLSFCLALIKTPQNLKCYIDYLHPPVFI